MRTQGHANADLVGTLRDGICQDAGESDGREQECRCAKESQQPAIQAFLSEGCLRARCLTTDLCDGQIAVQLVHDLAHCTGEYGRLARGAQREMHPADHFAFLLPRGVKQRLDLFALALVFGIGHHPNDLDLMLVVKDGDVLAEHLIAGEERASEGLIDDGDFGGTLDILRRETASGQERDFHRRKIVLAHHLPHGVVLRGSVFDLAGQQDVIEPIVIRDERDAPKRRGAHARQSVQPR